jgi:hypothetical protein
MTVRRRFAERFAHPRLAAAFLAGLAVLAAGTAVTALAPDAGTLGGRLLVVGYLLALAGGTGYLAFAAFEFRDRTLR